jgi:delta1-piperideine-2-carboxylate reductase
VISYSATCVKEYAEAVRSTWPVEGGSPVRMPFDRSAAGRRRRIAADVIEVPDSIHVQLKQISGA